jgi:hypothetical protein
METQDLALPDVRLRAIVGIALSNATQQVGKEMELAMTAGTRYDLSRRVMTIVVGKMAEVQPDLTVTQLLNVIETGRR